MMTDLDRTLGVQAARDVVAVLAAVHHDEDGANVFALVDSLPAHRARRALRLLALVAVDNDRDMLDRLIAEGDQAVEP